MNKIFLFFIILILSTNLANAGGCEGGGEGGEGGGGGGCESGGAGGEGEGGWWSGPSCECSGGQVETDGSCGQCGTLRRNCDGCYWGTWYCTGEGPCSPGQSENGGSCGQCGYLQRTCQGNCQWGGYNCVNQGSCSPGSTQCSGSRYQSCNSGCQWQNSGTDADGDGTDSQCGDSLCDNNPNFVNSNMQCNAGQTQCSNGRYQTCSNCAWQNSGTDSDGDGTDAQCGDSLCDNNPNFVNANRQCDAGQTQCSNGRYQTCSNCAWVNSGTNADSDAKDLQCGDSICDNSPNVYDDTRTPQENACSDSLDNDCDLIVDCNDNDCDGSIAGNVKDNNDAPIQGVDVSAKKDLTTIKSSTTNSQGSYNIVPLACGSYNLVASHPEYAPQTKFNVGVEAQQQTTSNFGGPGESNALVLGTSCEPDCTFVSDNIVHAACDTKNSCTFYDSIAKAACDNSQPGWVRDYNSTHFVTCASGTPQAKVEIKASVSCSSGTLLKITRIVTYNGKPVKLVVATCG